MQTFLLRFRENLDKWTKYNGAKQEQKKNLSFQATGDEKKIN